MYYPLYSICLGENTHYIDLSYTKVRNNKNQIKHQGAKLKTGTGLMAEQARVLTMHALGPHFSTHVKTYF